MQSNADEGAWTASLPPVATTQQVAQYLQVHPKTVAAMIEDGRLRALRTHPGRGGHWRIRREDVLALVAGAEAV